MMIGGNEQETSGLVREICELSARAISCSNLHLPRTNKSPFIDWYLVLRVNENADIYSIRKQYHKLALQLHPDKNNHSKAETAFKLVSETMYLLHDRHTTASQMQQEEEHSIQKENPFPASNATPQLQPDQPIIPSRNLNPPPIKIHRSAPESIAK